MVDAALSNYMPAIQQAQELRVAELESMKSCIRREPEKVEDWFNKEIEKAKSINSKMLFKQLGTY